MNHSKQTPSRLAEAILSWFCKGNLLEEILGDLQEYQKDLVDKPSWKRPILYWFNVFQFLRPSLAKQLSGTKKLNNYGMLKIYFKSSSRNFFKHRLISSMSLLSLVFGALCFHLVYVWINNEDEMDRFHKNVDAIHMSQAKFNPQSDFEPLSLQMFFGMDFTQFTHIRSALMIHTYYQGQIELITENRDFNGKGCVVDSTFFEFFDFKLNNGETKNLLTNPSNIILSHEYAEKVFGDTNPIGRTVQIRCDQTGTYQVAGVLEKIPSNSSISFDFLIPRHSRNFWAKIPQEFILVDSSFDPIDFNNQIAEMGRANSRHKESILSSIPFTSLYLEHPFDLSLFEKQGDSSSISTMKFIAVVILLITLLCFTGLQITLHLSSTRKMGVKRVIGATKWNLFVEVMVSRLHYLLISTVMAYLLFSWIFPWYTSIMEIQIDRNYMMDLKSILIVITSVTGISAIFIVAQLFKVEVKEALTNKLIFLQVPKIQRLLTTIQYSVTIVLIVGTVVVFSQFNFMINKDTGLDHERIISVDFLDMENRDDSEEEVQNQQKNFQYLVNQMMQNPDIVDVSQGELPISSIASPASWKRMGSDSEYTSQNHMTVDTRYDDILGIELIQGRFFSDSLDRSRQNKVVINEAAYKYWEFSDLKDAKLANTHWGGEEDPWRVIGVVKDYHYEHLSNEIKPLILLFLQDNEEGFLVKAQPGKVMKSVSFLEQLYKEVNPKGIFEYDLLEDKVEAQYTKEKRVGKVYLAFTVVALLLSSIGLFTFAFHETKRRTKEIGIRKINGAGVYQIFSMLSFSFLKSIIIAFVVACPVSWYFMNKWLENFAYRADIGWWLFVLTGLISVLVAMIAISWQTLDVARKNPVESLRYE
ncbi:MAG: ABC transporter permease [Cyclobacteriaceae bacterium]